jgi:hypothetical protein
LISTKASSSEKKSVAIATYSDFQKFHFWVLSCLPVEQKQASVVPSLPRLVTAVQSKEKEA